MSVLDRKIRHRIYEGPCPKGNEANALRAVLDLCNTWAERGPHSVRDHAGQDIRAAIARELGLSEEDNR